MKPEKKIQIAAIVVFALMTAAGNLISPFSSVWIVSAVAVAVCAICGFGMVCSVASSQNGGLGKWGGAGGVAFFCLFAISSIVFFPPELDSGGLELAAIFGNESMDRQASIAKAAQKALQLPGHEDRQAAARVVYLLSGTSINYRDASDQVQVFVPDEKAQRLVEGALTTQAKVKEIIDDHFRRSYSRYVVKLLGILAFVLAAGGTTLICTRQRENSLPR